MVEGRVIVKLEQVRNPVVIRKMSPFDGPDGWNVTSVEESGLIQTELLAMFSCEEPRCVPFFRMILVPEELNLLESNASEIKEHEVLS